MAEAAPVPAPPDPHPCASCFCFKLFLLVFCTCSVFQLLEQLFLLFFERGYFGFAVLGVFTEGVFLLFLPNAKPRTLGGAR